MFQMEMEPKSVGQNEKKDESIEGIAPHTSCDKLLAKKELIKEEYKGVIDWRESRYDRDVAEDPNRQGMRHNLDTHNGIVLDYATEISDKEKLTPREETEAIIATLMHDSGKLSSALVNHHEKGVQYADEMLGEMRGKKINGIEITEEVAQKVKEAIERHMNHPYMIMMNKGEKFPMPQDKVDKVVFDADMLANIGFKNVAFRLLDLNMLEKDKIRAKDGNFLAESFRNVLEGETTDDGRKIEGASGLKDIVMLDSSKEIAGTLINFARQILEDLKNSGSVLNIQKLFSDSEGNFNQSTVNKHGGTELLKKLLNEEIEKSAIKLGIDSAVYKRFEM